MDLKTFYKRHRDRHRVRVVFGLLFLCAAIPYFLWRLTVFNPDAPVFSIVFYTAEIFCLVLSCMVFFLSWQVRERHPTVAPDGLDVDVFVPTYNESLPMVRRTVQAAMNIAYPHETWLLDDGNRPEMQMLATELGCHYLTREDNIGAKPGNLNNALKHSTADFIAVIDCDHIAQRNYLHTLLGYFTDPDVAFVQAPQDYYNITAFQYRNDEDRGLLWHDQSAFFQIGQAGRDYWGATTCCGTSTVVRRSAVDAIGGFPEETVTEDMHLAIKVQKLGYKSVYYPLPLAYGVAPTDMGEYQKQRLRWGQGNVQSCREEGLPFCKNLTLAQRICYSYLGFLYLEGWVRLVFYLTPPIVLFTGIAPIGPTADFFWFFIPYFLATYLCFEEMGRGNLRMHINEQLCMARFPVFIASTFGVFRKRIKWHVSSKEFIGHLQLYLLIPQITVLLLSVGALIYCVIDPPQKLLAQYPRGLIGFVCMWAVFNAFIALLVIRDSARCARNRRPDYRFIIPLPVQISLAGGRHIDGVVEKISLVGMTLVFHDNTEFDPAAVIKGTLFIPGRRVEFQSRLENGSASIEKTHAGRTKLTCLFHWNDEAVSERLDMALHSCDWHRRISYGGAYFRTPMEWLECRLGLESTPKERAIDWEPALVGRALDHNGVTPSASDDQFALVSPNGWSGGPSLLVFQPLEVGTKLTVKAMTLVGVKEMDVQIAQQKWPSEELATGLDMQNAYTYDVRACEHEPTFALKEAAE